MRRLPLRASRLGLAFARAAGALAVAGAVSTASAHSQYPGLMQEHFAVACAPQCTLCHVSPAGGLPLKDSSEVYVDGAKPSHRGHGVFLGNLAAMTATGFTDQNLIVKLDALKATPCQSNPAYGDITDMGACDSDGDGKSDFDELTLGQDPDTSGAGPVCPTYGCGASIGTLPRDADKSGRAGAVIAALGVVLVLGRRVRR